MPIEIACGCGKRFRLSDAHAGKSGTCPACGAAFSVPVPKAWRDTEQHLEDGVGAFELAELDAPADVEIRKIDTPEKKRKGRTCSACNAPMAERAIICTACGRSTLTGKIVKADAEQDARTKRGFFLFRPLVEFGSLRVSPALLLVLALLIAVPVYWWVNGPGQKLAVYDAGRVWVLPAMTSGATRDGFSLLTGQGDMSLGVEGGIAGVVGGQADDGDALHYSVGGQDELWVLRDGDGAGADAGQGILLEVGLQQTVIRAAGSTSGYDAVVKASDFELVPLENQHGGAALPARLLSARFFKSEAVLDLGGAKTTNVHAALPTGEPTRFNEQKERGRVSAIAVYDGDTRGTVRLSASRSYDGMPAMPGVSATGQLTTTHPAAPGFAVEHRYHGGSVTVDWDDVDEGRWAKGRIREHADMSPYHRYKFGLLFLPPEDGGPVGGRYAVRYAGRALATVEIASGAAVSTQVASGTGTGSGASGGASGPSPVSPIRRQQGAPPTRQINPNNPLSYFDILLESRDRARGIVAASNLRQIGLSLLTYIDAHGDWPESFEELEGHVPGIQALLANPRTGEDPGFLYEKPAAGADPGATPVVWETFNGAKDPNGAVLYADGSIR
ncbi:MAG: hypothetical protein AAF328_03760 [Planctomycetota bacterium]